MCAHPTNATVVMAENDSRKDVEAEQAHPSYNVNMERDELLARIWIDPQRCFGKPCIRGHRIWVSLILDLLASGITTEEVLKEYPQLQPADILACIAYGSEMSRARYVDIPLEPAR